MNAEEIIRLLNLQPLPLEGGYFRPTFRSDEYFSMDCLPAGHEREKLLYSCIYYLVTPESFSSLHKIPSDEVFHFYLGDPVIMLQLHENGKGEIIKIGNDLTRGERPQVLVPKNTWQGSRLVSGGDFALLGTSVVPGFDEDDLVIAEGEDLLSRYPEFKKEILEFINLS